MAQGTIDPSNLKSFQKLSQEDVRYLKEVGKAAAFARECREARLKAQSKAEPLTLALCLQRVRAFFGRTADRLLYETVPVEEVYTSRE